MIAVACMQLQGTRQFLQIVLPLSKMISPVALQGTRLLCVKNTLMLYNWSGMFWHFWSVVCKKLIWQ
jgi:hypothetical protein